jgi:hypothetical protein
LASAGKAFFTGSVKNGFKRVDLEIMPAQKVPFNFIQKIAVHVDEGAAAFAFQVKMFPATGLVIYVLVTGAVAVIQGIFTDPPLGRHFFKMPVNGGLSDYLFRILKMTRYLINRYMIPLQGFQVIKDALSLPGMVICRTFTRHISAPYHAGLPVSRRPFASLLIDRLS